MKPFSTLLLGETATCWHPSPPQAHFRKSLFVEDSTTVYAHGSDLELRSDWERNASGHLTQERYRKQDIRVFQFYI